MKKILLITLLFVVSISLFGCSLLGKKESNEKQKTESQKQDQQKTEKPSSDADQNKEESFFGSMQDLMARGKFLKCTYKENLSDGSESEVVMYISGNKVRTEMEINTDTGEAIESHMIIDKDWMYMWNSFTPNGTKMNIKEMSKKEDVSDSDVNKGMTNLAKETDYKCRTWIPDNSKFTVPSDIEFMDITETMKDFQGTMQNIDTDKVKKSGEETEQQLCDMCEIIPAGPAKDSCLAECGSSD
ncbi:MAG: hypothetical protein U9M90_00760 [Patescibacteria group bacterium]|nr:hypothetical protein [Patescibacteria group bacterium]